MVTPGPAPASLTSMLRAPMKFVGLSGVGWLIDMAVYTLLVAGFAVGAFSANLVSGVCGAIFAFLTANRFVFAGSLDRLSTKLTLYILYTITQIVVASALVEAVARGLQYGAEHFRYSTASSILAIAAKCLVTPLTLVANYFVARSLSRRTK